MKPKKLSKKLSLNRKTIANLTGNVMTNVKGGGTITTVSLCETKCTCIDTICGNTCPTNCGSCNCTGGCTEEGYRGEPLTCLWC